MSRFGIMPNAGGRVLPQRDVDEYGRPRARNVNIQAPIVGGYGGYGHGNTDLYPPQFQPPGVPQPPPAYPLPDTSHLRDTNNEQQRAATQQSVQAGHVARNQSNDGLQRQQTAASTFASLKASGMDDASARRAAYMAAHPVAIPMPPQQQFNAPMQAGAGHDPTKLIGTYMEGGDNPDQATARAIKALSPQTPLGPPSPGAGQTPIGNIMQGAAANTATGMPGMNQKGMATPLPKTPIVAGSADWEAMKAYNAEGYAASNPSVAPRNTSGFPVQKKEPALNIPASLQGTDTTNPSATLPFRQQYREGVDKAQAIINRPHVPAPVVADSMIQNDQGRLQGIAAQQGEYNRLLPQYVQAEHDRAAAVQGRRLDDQREASGPVPQTPMQGPPAQAAATQPAQSAQAEEQPHTARGDFRNAASAVGGAVSNAAKSVLGPVGKGLQATSEYFELPKVNQHLNTMGGTNEKDMVNQMGAKPADAKSAPSYRGQTINPETNPRVDPAARQQNIQPVPISSANDHAALPIGAPFIYNGQILYKGYRNGQPINGAMA